MKAGLEILFSAFCLLFSAFPIAHRPFGKVVAAVVAGVDDGAPACGGRFFMGMWVSSTALSVSLYTHIYVYIVYLYLYLCVCVPSLVIKVGIS